MLTISRRRLWPCLAVLLVSSALAGTVLAQGMEPAPFPDDDAIQAIIEQRVASGANAGLVVGVADRNGTRFFSAGKIADELDSPPTKDSTFEIGSVTKVFTGTLLAQAVLRRQAALNAPLSDYLPEPLAPRFARITLLELATHSSGLPRMPTNWKPADPAAPYADYDADLLLAYLSSKEHVDDKGSFAYSNLGFGLLGYLLATREKKDYGALTHDWICRPLGLERTATQLTGSMAKHLAQGHNAGGKTVPLWEFDALAGCGAIKSTPADLLRFVAANAGLVPAPEELDKAFRLARTPHGDGPEQGVSVGLGWMLIDLPNASIVFHDGGTGGYRAFVGFDPVNGKAVALLSNTSADVSDIGLHLLEPSIPLRQPRTPVALDQQLLGGYAGSYVVTPGSFVASGLAIQISLRDGKLFYSDEDEPEPAEIAPLSRTEFFFRETWDVTLDFLVNEQHEVVGLALRAGGETVKALKVE